MLQLYENIKERRKSLDMTQEELAQKVGYCGKSMIAKVESGQVDLPQSKILAFADALEISPGELMGTDGLIDAGRRTKTIPVLGRVAAGIPIDAEELIIDTEELPEKMARTGEFFALRIKGDSMEPDIHDGDTVIVRQQNDADSDEIVIALVNGNDGVCKRLKKYGDSIALISSNAAYSPMYFSQSEVDETPVRVIGKVVEIRRKL